MKRLVVFALAIAGVIAGAIGVVPSTTTALPPDVIPGPNSITGTVTDEQGNPLNGVFVIDSTFTFSTFTDFDGTYLLDGLTSGTEYSVIAADQTGAYPQAQSDPVVASDAGPVVLDFVLHPFPTSSISGTVTDQDGVPLAGIGVRDQFTNKLAVSDANGRYVLDGLRLDQSYQLVASDPTGAHRFDFGFVGSVAPDGSTVLDFHLVAIVPALVGTVTDPDGAPVEGVSVFLREFGLGVTTGADGKYFIGDLGVSGDYTLDFDTRFSRPELRPVSLPVTLAAGTTVEVNVQLTRTATIDVTVTAGGAPADAHVRVWSAAGFNVAASLDVGPDGTVSLPIFNDGEYYLEVESNNFEFAGEFFPDTVFRENAQRFTILGEQHIPVAVDLERAATISGIITMPDGSLGDFSQVKAMPVGFPDDQIFASPSCNLPQPDDAPGTYRAGCLHPSVDWVLKGFGSGQADNGFYLNSQSSFNATPIAVDPGQAVTGIDIQLQPKSPDPTITGVSQQFFVTGTTTPGVHIFGTNFPADFHAITVEAFSGAFFNPVDLTVTGRVSATELIATVAVPAGDIGPLPAQKQLLVRTSMGGGSESGVTLVIGDPTTPVATVSGRVTDSRGRGVGGISVLVTSTTLNEFGGRAQTSTTTFADGRWTAQGVSPGTYTVQFEGTEAFNSQFWKQRTTATTATPITLNNGDIRTGINATLTRREPIKVFGASPRLQVPNLSFDLVGQGLGPIRGGFRVFIATAFGNFPLQAESVSSSRLHVTGFAFAGTWDIVTQWTGDDGTVKSTTCVGCIKVYDDLSAFAFDDTVQAGTTATLDYFGSGLVDITKVTVSGKDVKVVKFATSQGSNIDITFAVKKGAATGTREVTITRIDGRSFTTFMVVGAPF